jgi:elongation factor G
MICGSAFKNKGVQFLLMLFVDIYLLLTIKKLLLVLIQILIGNFKKTICFRTFSALAFKIATDPFVGRLAFL